MKSFVFALSTICIASTVAAAPVMHQAQLAGHAILPAKTFIQLPHDAPQDLKVSGKFVEGKRNNGIANTMGKSNGRATQLQYPFQGQAVQGHSGIKVMKDGSVWLLTDNGFGNKKNSTDSALFLRHYKIDWKNNNLHPIDTVFLRDPDQKVPFRIIHENTKERYLTGGDFDPESVQIANDRIWIGEEFGPYLLEADMTGKVLAVHDTVVDGKVVRSPDHPSLTLPGIPNQNTAFEVKRSKGFEGMAMSPNGQTLYPMLEGVLWDKEKQTYENVDGKQYLRILEFDTQSRKYTNRSWKYILESNDHAIGDFNMIDAHHGLIIERDNHEGTSAYPCATTDTSQCFDKPAKFKRIYKVRLADNGVAEKMGYIDLMDIQDNKQLSKKPLVNGKFVFPFFTIENVDMVDKNHIIVGNDNNLPFSSSRHPNQVDDNELILFNIGDFLQSK